MRQRRVSRTRRDCDEEFVCDAYKPAYPRHTLKKEVAIGYRTHFFKGAAKRDVQITQPSISLAVGILMNEKFSDKGALLSYKSRRTSKTAADLGCSSPRPFPLPQQKVQNELWEVCEVLSILQYCYQRNSECCSIQEYFNGSQSSNDTDDEGSDIVENCQTGDIGASAECFQMNVDE